MKHHVNLRVEVVLDLLSRPISGPFLLVQLGVQIGSLLERSNVHVGEI